LASVEDSTGEDERGHGGDEHAGDFGIRDEAAGLGLGGVVAVIAKSCDGEDVMEVGVVVRLASAEGAPGQHVDDKRGNTDTRGRATRTRRTLAKGGCLLMIRTSWRGRRVHGSG
jgi:hypothetical protein